MGTRHTPTSSWLCGCRLLPAGQALDFQGLPLCWGCLLLVLVLLLGASHGLYSSISGAKYLVCRLMVDD
jgi:hypothetical protein